MHLFEAKIWIEILRQRYELKFLSSIQIGGATAMVLERIVPELWDNSRCLLVHLVPNYTWWGEQASGYILEEMKVSCWDLRRHKSVREPWAWVGELAPTKSTLHKFQSHPQICVPPRHWHFYHTKIAGFEIFTDSFLLFFTSAVSYCDEGVIPQCQTGISYFKVSNETTFYFCCWRIQLFLIWFYLLAN